jgi:flagellar hook-length control protein FliK
MFIIHSNQMMARSLLLVSQPYRERLPVLGVTSETATSVSFPNTRHRSERDDQSMGNTFESLVDINAQASQASAVQTSNLPDQHDMHPDRLPNASRPDRTAPADDNAQTRGSQASSGRQPQTDSAAGPGTGIQKPAGGEASNTAHHHRAKHEDPKGTKDASYSQLAASDVSTTDSSAPSQAAATPPAVAVPVTTPIAATPSAAAAPAATAAADSATASGATEALSAQAASAAQGASAGTGFKAAADTAAVAAAIVKEATIPPDTRQAAQTAAMQADGALVAAVAAATPAEAKTNAKTLDNTRPGKTTPPVVTGLQPGSVAPDATVTSAASSDPVQPHDAAPGDHKHSAVTTDNAKTAASDNGTPATQPGAAAPQHPASPAKAAAAQPQIGQPDSGQPQSINSALAQPQMQPAAPTTPVVPQLNVALAGSAAVPLSGLAVQIAVTARSGSSRFEIRLDPADLGRIDVRLDVDRQGRVTSHLTVEKPETLAMLRQDAPQLQRALQDAGLKTGDGGLQFSLRDQSSQGQNSRDDSGRNAQRLIVSEDNIVPAVAAGRSYGRILGSSSGLDIKV